LRKSATNLPDWQLLRLEHSSPLLDGEGQSEGRIVDSGYLERAVDQHLLLALLTLGAVPFALQDFEASS